MAGLKIIPVLLVLLSILWTNVNIISIIFGTIVVLLGEFLRLKEIKTNLNINLGANSIIYIGLIIISNAFFPYMLIITFLFFLLKDNKMKVSNELQKHFDEKKYSIRQRIAGDLSVIKSWGLVWLAFILIWGIRRF